MEIFAYLCIKSRMYAIALSLALRLSNNNIIAVWIETIALNTAATTLDVQKIHLAAMSLFFGSGKRSGLSSQKSHIVVIVTLNLYI